MSEYRFLREREEVLPTDEINETPRMRMARWAVVGDWITDHNKRTGRTITPGICGAGWQYRRKLS